MSEPRRAVLRATVGVLAMGVPAWGGDDGYGEVVRRTWRHGEGTPHDRTDMFREVVRYTTLAPNGHNTQPWKFRLRKDGVDILPDYSRRTPVVDPDDHHLWVSLGCAAENLLQAAAGLGWKGLLAVTGTGVQIDLSPSAVQRSVLFEAIPRRHSSRGEYDGRPLGADQIRLLERAASALDVRVEFLTNQKQLKQVRDSVIAGNTAQMADPAFIRELKAWIRFNKGEAVERKDGLFAGSSGNADVPRWLGSLMFGLLFRPDAENDKYAKQIRSSAGVAVFAAAQANPSGWVAAGCACERFLLQAAALDVRTAFINQPVEVKTVRTQFASMIGLGDQRPDLVVRFGHGPLLPASLRRPLDAVLIG